MFWLFRSGKALLHSAAVKARHAELAFRDASRSMHGTTKALQEMHDLLRKNTPKKLAKNVFKTMRRVERHAKILRRHTIELRKHMVHLEHQAREASKHKEGR